MARSQRRRRCRRCRVKALLVNLAGIERSDGETVLHPAADAGDAFVDVYVTMVTMKSQSASKIAEEER